MAIVAISDGTTTKTLSGDGSAILGCTYFPVAPTPAGEAGLVERGPVTERADVVLEGTAAAILAAVNAVETLLDDAERRQRSGLGTRVYVQYTSPEDGSAWRSEVLSGQVLWSEDPARRRLNATSNAVEVAVVWERRFFWEGAETALELSSSVTGTPTTSAVGLYNNDDGTVGETNWLNIADDQVEGTLPAPLKLMLFNDQGAAVNWRTFYLANNVFSDPENMDVFLHGSEAVGGATTSWTGESEHSDGERWAWALGDTLLADTQGRFFRLLVTFSTMLVDTYFKASVAMDVSGSYYTIYEGEEVAGNDRELLDLGLFPLPPGGFDGDKSSVAITISVRRTLSGPMTIDFVQLTPSGPGQFRRVKQVSFSTDDGDALVDDGVEGLVYIEETGGKHYPIVRPYDVPLHVWPGRAQRLRVLFDESPGPAFSAGRQLTAQAWYRPRRLAV